MTTFKDLGAGKKLCTSIAAMGWTEPTPIQEKAIPVGLSGRDLLGQARTGTGKTGAFSVVALGRTKAGSKTPTTLVLSPTRELADQISKEMKELSKATHHVVVPLYGGTSYAEQLKALSAGCDVVVGTPGRVMDLMGKGALVLSSVKELVVDEADRMLDMGFVEDVFSIARAVPEKRHTMMFSATISDEVREVASAIMKDPETVSVSQDGVAADSVRQYYVEVKRNGKMDVLRDILANGEPKTIVFCSTKKMVDDLYEGMSREGTRVGAIHGDMPQSRREKTIRGFRANKMSILIATDVAARGLDIDDVECLVNYDAPLDPETYVHRIGRTGRAGREGVAFTMVTPREDLRIPSYQEFTGEEIERVTRKMIPGLEIANPELKALHPVKREKPKPAVPEQRRARRGDCAVISLDIPKSMGATRTDISEFVMSAVHVGRDSLGRIGMSEAAVFVEIAPEIEKDALKALNGASFRGRKVRASPASAKAKRKEGESRVSALPFKSIK
ncbi:MAG: DEAD/DEAH box helicase [Candidatus Methanomethylophilaceae archaeon]|nr:DEAD/DEAH box helicase [Candidatus Methanomethylophilaceae archaeon]